MAVMMPARRCTGDLAIIVMAVLVAAPVAAAGVAIMRMPTVIVMAQAIIVVVLVMVAALMVVVVVVGGKHVPKHLQEAFHAPALLPLISPFGVVGGSVVIQEQPEGVVVITGERGG